MVERLKQFWGHTYLFYVEKLLIILLILFFAFLATHLLKKAAKRLDQKGAVDPTYHHFFLSVGRFTIKVFSLVLILSNLDVDVSSLVALFGTAGFGIGLSLKGTLANFAGGFSILMFKTVKAGEFIDTKEGSGKVLNIEMTHTKILTSDGHHILIPNGTLVNLSIKKILQ